VNLSGYHEMKNSRKRMTHNESKKFILTIVWNPHGFHLIKVIDKGRKFNAGYFIAEILESLSQRRSIEAPDNK
jgi:hypothetical protein